MADRNLAGRARVHHDQHASILWHYRTFTAAVRTRPATALGLLLGLRDAVAELQTALTPDDRAGTGSPYGTLPLPTRGLPGAAGQRALPPDAYTALVEAAVSRADPTQIPQARQAMTHVGTGQRAALEQALTGQPAQTRSPSTVPSHSRGEPTADASRAVVQQPSGSPRQDPRFQQAPASPPAPGRAHDTAQPTSPRQAPEPAPHHRAARPAPRPASPRPPAPATPAAGPRRTPGDAPQEPGHTAPVPGPVVPPQAPQLSGAPVIPPRPTHPPAVPRPAYAPAPHDAAASPYGISIWNGTVRINPGVTGADGTTRIRQPPTAPAEFDDYDAWPPPDAPDDAEPGESTPVRGTSYGPGAYVNHSGGIQNIGNGTISIGGSVTGLRAAADQEHQGPDEDLEIGL